MTNKKTISILGCGWYGLPLAKALIANGFSVKGSTTSREKLPVLKEAKVKPYLIHFEEAEEACEADFFDSEILFVTIPPKSKSVTGLAYIAKIEGITRAAGKAGVKQVIFTSSTGVYADEGLVVNENTIPRPVSDTGKILFAAEEIFHQNPAFTTTIIRFAGLTGPGRNLARHFAGRKEIPNGLAPVNLIHLNDCIGITLAILKKKAFGLIYNAVAPEHPSRAVFYTKACRHAGLRLPEFRNELLEWKQVDSIHVPQILTYLKYEALTAI